MLECHIHNGGDIKAHVFWGSEAFLTVGMGHSLGRECEDSDATGARENLLLSS